MLSFLFWNLNGNNPVDRSEAIGERISRLARNFDIDIFIFVESSFESTDLANFLTNGGAGEYWHSKSECRKVSIFSRLAAHQMLPQHDSDDDRLTVQRVIVPPHEILLAAVHLRSQLHQNESAAGFQMTVVQNDIAVIEKDLDNYHTLVVGDFNLNPFDHGMVAAQAMHGVMVKSVANATERIVEGRSYRFFYNPMWGLLGDQSTGPPGTYYYSASSSMEYFWNMFDQVLLRPELMETLQQLEVLDTDGEFSLLNQLGRPDKQAASDHLPILFRLDLDLLEKRS